MINFEQKKSPLGLSYAAWDSVLDNPNAWSARMQLTGQWQCKRVVKWNAISQLIDLRHVRHIGRRAHQAMH